MLLELARALARDDLDHRRLDPDRLVEDVLQRLVDVPAPVVNVVQVELELHRPPLGTRGPNVTLRLVDGVICVLGDAHLDVVFSLSGPFAADTDTPARTSLSLGGQAANVAAWVVALGGRSRLIAA